MEVQVSPGAPWTLGRLETPSVGVFLPGKEQTKMRKKLLLEPSVHGSVLPEQSSVPGWIFQHTHQNTGGKSMSNHPQILRMEFGGGGIIESFPDSFSNVQDGRLRSKTRGQLYAIMKSSN